MGSIVVKAQEVIGGAVSQLAPSFGAIAGGLGGLVTPMGPSTGAAAGVIAGVGAANSLGTEVGRVDFSSAMINRLLAASQPQTGINQTGLEAGPSVAWRSENFVKVDLVPQGFLWLRICEVAD